MKRCTVEHLNFTRYCGNRIQVRLDDFILPYSAVYLRIQKWKNYGNRSTFAKVIVKIKVAPFLMARGVVSDHHHHHHYHHIPADRIYTDKRRLSGNV